MKSMIRWAVDNTPAMNMIMVSVMAIGALCYWNLHREEFPQFDLEMILVTVPYPGASPEEVESGICQKIEESIRSIENIKKVMSIANEGAGSVVIELEASVPDVQKVLGEIESAVDRIPSFPDLAEEPEIQQVSLRRQAIKVGVIGPPDTTPDAEWHLRELTEAVREEILLLPSITVAEIAGSRDYQIDIEISEENLRKYNLTLRDVAQRVRLENLEMPGGNLKTESQEFLLRGKNKRVTGKEIEKIPLVTKADGVVLTVADLGHVRDEFVDTTAVSRINGEPGLLINVAAAKNEDLLQMTKEVRDYVQGKQLPAGYSLIIWGDTSVDVEGRLEMVKENGGQGLVLVVIVLALFLDLRLSFWVSMGIPFAMLGTCIVLYYFGQTLNMLSMFAFLIALGIVVDDAIVIGENINIHRGMGKSYYQAAIDGVTEVAPSVFASVATTMIAFMPMFFVSGVMGKFFAVLPLAVIATLVISVLEGVFILPVHLAHGGPETGPRKTLVQRFNLWRESQTAGWIRATAPAVLAVAWLLDVFLYPFRRLRALVEWLSVWVNHGLRWLIGRLYLPSLTFSLKNPLVVLASAATLLMFAVALVRSDRVPWIFFPKFDSRLIESKVTFPNGTPGVITEEAVGRIQQTLAEMNREYEQQHGRGYLRVTYESIGSVVEDDPGRMNESSSGSQVGAVKVELVENTERSITSQQIVEEWRRRVGPVAGAESVTFGSFAGGPGGTPIEFKLLANAEKMEELEAAVEKAKAKLGEYPGVFDITDDSRPGKWEYQLTMKEKALALGIPLESIASTVRATYYGEEVMRLQRGRHEVKLMVRYPPEERESLRAFDEIEVEGPDGVRRPLTELAEITTKRGYAEINRLDQKRSITITSDIDTNVANASNIVADLQKENGFLDNLLKDHPGVTIRWEGQQEQSQESVQSLMIGFVVALVAMYVLLTLEFRSYVQPVIVMAVIPFGIIGAIYGHYWMGLPLSLFSVMGIVALSGVVVNNSIVLVDFINSRYQGTELDLEEALLEAGERRLRPMLLTTLTDVVGLYPLLIEKSFQAQLLIPMAVSIGFGLMLSTILVLYLVPVFYMFYRNVIQLVHPHGHDPHSATTEPVTAEA